MTKREASFRGTKIGHDFVKYRATCNTENCSFDETMNELYRLKDKCGKHYMDRRHNSFTLERIGDIEVRE